MGAAIRKSIISRETESNRRPKDHRKFPLQSSALPTELSRVSCHRAVIISSQQHVAIRACPVIVGPSVNIFLFKGFII